MIKPRLPLSRFIEGIQIVKKLVVFLGLLLLATQTLLSQASGPVPVSCDERKEKAALDAVGKLREWHDVYRAFKEYGTCDDGAIGEGFSDAVVRLLATKPGAITEVWTLVKQDKRFRRFIVRHIDETTAREDLQKVIENATTTNCAKANRDFCSEVRKSAESALRRL